MTTSGLSILVQGEKPPRLAAVGSAADMPAEPSKQGDAIETKHRCVLFFSIEGDLRFISHQDTMRVFHRMLARADVPVRFSEGFNPHPRMSLLLPRPVGIASLAEACAVEFRHAVNAREIMERMSKQSPVGLAFLDARELATRERLRPAQVRYRLDLDGLGVRVLPGRVEEIMTSDSLPLKRFKHSNGTTKIVDVRPFIENIMIAGDALEYTLRVTDAGTARPAEIAALLGVEASPINHRIRRMEVLWESKQ